jgi:predicted MPP superfamily phosphohydrolase
MNKHILLALMAAVWTWANLVEPFHPRLRRRTLSIDKLPRSLDGFTILHLSDLHTRKMGVLERTTIALLSQASADIAVLTGDLLDTENGIEPLRQVLAHVRARLGVYVVWGNAEHQLAPPSHKDALERCLREAGVHLLNNDARFLTYDDATIWLAGVDDPHSGHADLPGVTPHGRIADLHLLLAHSPDVLLHPLTGQYDLILCGHTHGGQIRLPGWGALWSHTRLGRWAGDYVLTPSQIARRLHRPLPQPYVIISPGIATVGPLLLKARLFCPPEMTVIRLQATSSVPAHTQD